MTSGVKNSMNNYDSGEWVGIFQGSQKNFVEI